MLKAKTIIFDCDGVLIDSELIANRVIVKIKKEHGIFISLEDQLKTFTGLSDDHPLMQEELKRVPSDYLKVVHEKIREAYHTELSAIDGVTETLGKISIPMCVASNSDHASLLFKLKLTGLDHFFKGAAFSAQMVKHGKPAPDLFLLAVEKMKWKPEDCLVIEDSVAGVTAAKAAGLRVCAFIGGGHMYPGHAEKLLALNVDHIVSDFRDVLQFI